MRKILFKAKRVDNGEWVEGDLVHDGFDGTSKTLPVGIQSSRCYPVEVHPETVCQYTGLKDKNGVKIFEWDRVKVGEYDEDEDLWIDDSIHTVVNGISYNYPAFDLSPEYGCGEMNSLSEIFSSSLDIKVLGSIHDKEVHNA